MNKLNEVRQFKKIAGLLKESHPANDMWYEDFEDGLKNLVHNKYISKSEFKYYMDALDHIDPMDGYGHMASGHDAAKEFVDDLKAKKSVKESGTGDEPFDFNKAAIQSASGDKISHTEKDDEGEPIYWSAKNPNVNYYIGGDDQIIKYDGETGERYPIGDLRDYDEPRDDYEPDTDADYEEPGDDFDMAEVNQFKKIAGIKEVSALKIGRDDIGNDFLVMNKDSKRVQASYNGIRRDGEHVFNAGSETIVVSPKDLDARVSRAGSNLEEDDYSENPSSDMDYDSESGDTATMGNIDEDDMDNRANQDSKTQYGQGGILNL